ncbi:MAG: hypothetical protein IPP74_13215 [Alphaproteobacteria bacterium]|nr:hypothetical protein [Alphaproteobacteria bacterium]
MTRINVRTKGAVGEREAAAILQKVVDEVFTSCGHEPPKLRRNVEQAQVGGEDLVGLPWYSFEIKRVERIDLDKWWQQTLTQAARKPPLASMALAQRFGGWKSLAAGSAKVGTGALGEAVGSVPGAGCGAAGAGRVEVGSAGSHEAAVRPVAGQGVGVDRPAWALPRLDEAMQGTIEQCSFVRGSVAPSQAIPLPIWASARTLELVPSANGGPVGSLGSVGGPLPVACVGGLGEGQGKPVSSPLEGGSPLVATLTRSEGPNAEKPLPMAREGVLIWRQNSRSWQVRFLGTLVSHNGTRLASVVDASLESWLKLFREDLRARLRT